MWDAACVEMALKKKMNLQTNHTKCLTLRTGGLAQWPKQLPGKYNVVSSVPRTKKKSDPHRTYFT